MKYVPFRFCRVKLLLTVLGFILICCSSGRADTSGPINLKTRTQSFTHEYDFIIDDGKILIRPRLNGHNDDDWELFNNTGLPGKNDSQYISSVEEISTDGDNLIATSDLGRVFYTKLAKIKWKAKWGAPIAKALILLPNRAWAISHRSTMMEYYEDIDGNRHPTAAGVTSLFLLAENGHEIFYADPWLPPRFGHEVGMPDKGRFIAKNMAVSASTLFIINKAGQMYTRLHDFDVAGHNPVLPYSYRREQRSGINAVIRSLPPEDWRQQPHIDGQITDSITIFQTGEKGNSAFILRVEGLDASGETGFYSKYIYDSKWTFTAHAHSLHGKLLKNPANVDEASLLAAKKAIEASGTIARRGVSTTLNAQFISFLPTCPPALLRVQSGEETVDLKLHMRRLGHSIWGTTKCKATLEIPDHSFLSENDRKVWGEMFRGESLIDFHVEVFDDKIKIVEDLHILGIDEVADVIHFNIIKHSFSKGALSPKWGRPRLRMIFEKK